MSKPDYEKLWRNADSALEAINKIMWESYMVKGREFGREQGAQIMMALNLWCQGEDAAQSEEQEAAND